MRRLYTPDLQHEFARLSGDFNPIHVDPVAARRTVAGGLVVHGIHHLLAALDFAVGTNADARGVTEINAKFLKPVLSGDTLAFEISGSDPCKIVCRNEGEITGRVSIRFGGAVLVSNASLPALPCEEVAEPAFEELAGKAGRLPLGLDVAQAQQLFPRALAVLGPEGMTEVLAVSRLVGMHCPGLHSLLTEVALRFDGAGTPGFLEYRVQEAHPVYRQLVMAVNGPHLHGSVTSFYRPPPVTQPGMPEVARVVEGESFAVSRALIVGGSRGLGEVTAKIIAAGGGLPVITYHSGADDAARVAGEILAWGGRCEVVQLDVLEDMAAVNRIFAAQDAPHSIYYFATAKIGARRGFFNHALLQEYQKVYVGAFGRLLDAALAANPVRELRAFYPSTVFVADMPQEFAEYAMAKKTGEELCAFYNQHSQKIRIVCERLPRLKTDQTSALLAAPAQDALEAMLPHVRLVELGSGGKRV